MDPQPSDQSRYQVRLEWGIEGLARLAPADVVVVVDVLLYSTTVTDAVGTGESVSIDVDAVAAGGASAVAAPAAAIAARAAASGALVLLGGLRNPTAVAEAVLAEQHRRADRTSIALIAVGDRDSAGVRFAVEDQLGAGAIADALAVRGIDHSSPEAAVACEAYRGLGRAVRHLLTASGSGQSLLDHGERDAVLSAAQPDATDVVAVLRDGAFRAL